MIGKPRRKYCPKRVLVGIGAQFHMFLLSSRACARCQWESLGADELEKCHHHLVFVEVGSAPSFIERTMQETCSSGAADLG